MGPVRFGTQVCTSLAAGGTREWLVADGRGGFAMGTVSGLRTRRYHGLLVVAGDNPARRHLGLASLDPIVTLDSGATVRLGVHEWASGAIAPAGHELLESFELRDGLPCWRWRVGSVVLERVVAMRHGSPTVVVRHTLLAGGPVDLAVEAVGTWRDGHGERVADDDLTVDPTGDGVVVAGAYRVAGPGFVADPAWFHGVRHRVEAARGLAATEDLLRFGRFTARLEQGQSLDVHGWAGDEAALASAPPPAGEIVAAARRRWGALVSRAGVDPADETGARLVGAADSFVVTTPRGPDVVAGYPWFGAWSRDTMIAYPGLFLSTGRADEGRELLRSYAATLSEGMLANTADTAEVSHNTADATLWFAHAVERHVRATGDTDLAAELIGPLTDVVARHRAGTRFGIRIDSDGLLTQGAPGLALTWMDAVIHSGPVTPRAGKTVELNALWINALGALAELSTRVGRDPGEMIAARRAAVASFIARFPTPGGWLHDVVDSPDPANAGGDDPRLRPNQLFAISLPHAPLHDPSGTPEHADLVASVLRVTGDHLLTPLGLRTLARTDRDFVGAHQGDPTARDLAYHQGTVWPWLLGPYVDALAAADPAVDRRQVLAGVRAHLSEWGLGSVSETADGDAPHDATGCPFQAWSVAETLRVWRDAAT